MLHISAGIKVLLIYSSYHLRYAILLYSKFIVSTLESHNGTDIKKMLHLTVLLQKIGDCKSVQSAIHKFS